MSALIKSVFAAVAVVSFALSSGALAAPPLSAVQIRASTKASTPRALALFREYLALPNDSHKPEDIRGLADWVEKAFRSRGFKVRRLATKDNPLLLAERRHPGATKTVLVYLQADGQPVDPAAWNQASPFQPVLKRRAGKGWKEIPWARLDGRIDPDWRIFARSASDSKGPNIQFLTAIDMLADKGVVPPFHLKVVIDTEEELGSPHLAKAVVDNRQRLAADLLYIFDGPPHPSGRPTLSFGARGITDVTLTTYGPKVPQHSGHFGNYAPNPAFHLARILGSMKTQDGRVADHRFLRRHSGSIKRENVSGCGSGRRTGHPSQARFSASRRSGRDPSAVAAVSVAQHSRDALGLGRHRGADDHSRDGYGGDGISGSSKRPTPGDSFDW